ncbi:MAG: hypothetical protein AB1589_30315 [Cyanobacteriota bacterium]
MTYQERLNPWTIVRMQPNQQKFIVARFRRRIDAEGHLRILKQVMPNVELAIAFASPKNAVSS